MIAAGEQLAGYTILRLLGRGGMGEVYLAQHRRVDRRAAIKVLVPELSQNATVLDRFFNEARAASLIHHPGIVEILDCDLFHGQAFIIMEFLDGESLGGYLYRTGPLEGDLPFLLGVGVSVASAVGAAHATGIIHRDLKPDNIHLHLAGAPGAGDPSVAVKILDFGIAKLAQHDGSHGQTRTGAVLGTPAYMSPEQCRGAARVDTRSDIYSFGCILYEALCGWPPFVREGMGDLIVAHVSESPQPPAARVAGLAPSLNALILRMLEKSPEARPSTMEEVAAGLRDCARALGIPLHEQLRPRLPVERTRTAVVAATDETQAPPPSGPSGVPTTPLGPKRRASAAAVAATASAAAAATARGATGVAERAAAPAVVPIAAAAPVADQVPAAEEAIAQADESPRAAPRKPTTLGSTAAEMNAESPATPRWGRRAVVGGGAAAVVVAAALVLARRAPSTLPATGPAATRAAPPTVAPTATPEQAAAVAAPPVPVAPTPSTSAAASAVPPPAATPDTVRIDIRGAPANIALTLDNQPASLPIRVPRGPEIHHLVLRVPGESPRKMDIDGTHDRSIDVMSWKQPTAAQVHGVRDRAATGAGATHPSPDAPPPEQPGTPAAKTPAKANDREAITDI